MKSNTKISRRRWTGLSPTQIGMARYLAGWRALKFGLTKIKTKRPVGRPRLNRSAAFRRRQLRLAWNRYGRRVRAERRALGLTALGTVPKYERHQIQFHGPKRKAARQRIYRARRAEQGLTSNGKPKRRGVILLTPFEIQWRQFRNQLPTIPSSDWDIISR